MTCARNLAWAWSALVFLGLIATVGSLAGYPHTDAPARNSLLEVAQATDACPDRQARERADASTLALASHQVPAEPLPARADPVAIIMEYVDGARADPLLQLDDFVWVKSSNYRGVEIDGQIYYYRLSPHASFDPLSRGAVDGQAVRVWKVIRDAEFTVVIYTIDDEPARSPSFSARLTREPRVGSSEVPGTSQA